MTQPPLTFALPGKLSDKTGGTTYDRHLIVALRTLGHDVEVLELEGAFPDPSTSDRKRAVARLIKVPRDRVLIVDGLALGVLSEDELRRIGAPIVAMLHHPLGMETGLSNKQAHTLIESENAALSCVRHVLAPSPHVAQTVQELFNVLEADMTIVRPGAMPPSPAGERNAKAKAKPPLILSVGLLHRRKGHDILLEALSQIQDIDWQARIVGREHDPDEAARLREKVSQLDLSPRVTLAGEVSTDELLEDYARATVFALATRYEGHGLVFDEAMMNGLPIVSCEIGAVPNTVPDEAGILVPPDDAEAFAVALRQVLTQPALRASLSDASYSAGTALPSWTDAARIVSSVVGQLQHPGLAV